ncbi:MAG: RelA/SpoT family protein [Bacteroidales bacterium]|nr:RelA/SpoT family protein [Bacteroidales bacterium]
MSLTEFTREDFKVIESEWQSLHALAQGRCRTEEELRIVEKAFDFANHAHQNVRRRSGAPYMLHPIAVAKIVVDDIGLGYKSICAALLHDVVEDTNYTVDDIRTHFGDKIASLVDGLTKIKTVLDNEDRKNRGQFYMESLQAENFKRILLTLNDDARVVLIKMADRLHNCRTIEYMPEHKRDKILSETMFIFIPLAHRLGLYSIKSELENIWLKYKEPEDYAEICRKVSQNVAERDSVIDEFIAPIQEALTQIGCKFEIKKRIKTPYSIWYKMKTKKVLFEEVYDLYAVRIIYDTDYSDSDEERKMAYIIYATLTKLYNDQPARFRDWIKQPKSNGYEALHCTLMSRAGIWIEAQIRSRRMDDIAEKGIAAHWAYKNDGYITENDAEMEKLLAMVQEVLGSKDINSLELLDIIHGDLIASDIVVFTPKGEQRTIKYGSTVIDFAYNIHTHIGNTAIAAKINMKLVPLSQVLRSGDQVEIITARTAQPKVEWLQFVKTRHAKAVIIEYFRSRFDEFARKGKGIFEERLAALNFESSVQTLKKFMEYSQLNDIDELYFRIGLGLIGPEDFKNVLTEPALHTTDNGDDVRYVLATCCNPIPGDSVVGIKSENNVVTVHKKTCEKGESLAAKFGNRVVVPQWVLQQKDFPVRISFRGIDRVGILNEISYFISRTMGVNMRRLQLGTDEGIFEGYIELLVKDKSTLNDMINGLKKIDGLQDVIRTDM